MSKPKRYYLGAPTKTMMANQRDIFADDRRIGYMVYVMDGTRTSLHITDIRATLGANSLGISAMRQIARQLKAEGVLEVGGMRVTGTHAAAARAKGSVTAPSVIVSLADDIPGDVDDQPRHPKGTSKGGQWS